MRKTTLEALELIEAWLKSYKRRQWIRSILDDYLDAYCQENSPVSAADAPELERLRRKIGDWYGKAHRNEENLCHAVNATIPKRFRRNKTVMRRYMEVSLQIASEEFGMPLEDLPGYKKFIADLKAGKY